VSRPTVTRHAVACPAVTRPATRPAVTRPATLRRTGEARPARLLVLAKQPVPGRVKTRLCPPCTPDQAARVAAAALADTLDAVARTPVAGRVLAVDGTLPAPAGFDRVVPQHGAGLGERIAQAFSDSASTVPRLPVLQLGMDTPQVGEVLLAECVDRLLTSTVDDVVGLAEDGGWWALGLRDPRHAALVREVPMSTDRTGELTVRALRSAGLRTALLPTLRDVDHFPDAVAVAALVPGGRFAGAVRAVRGELA
jgi:glycosyltransferase A (GT-A) superfamily protein (DUF2064 family)